MAMIRAARPEEFEAVGELTAHAYLEGGHISETSDYGQVLRDAGHRAANAELLVCVDGDKVLGSVTVARHGDRYADIAGPGELEFRMLAVAPEAAGRGVGRELVRAVLDRARAEGLDRVVLSSQESMTIAHRLYESLGFRRAVDRDWQPVPGLQLIAYTLEPV
ncbi:GNAT family N-acetyltransferase [Parasphingorhabdus pacifica]